MLRERRNVLSAMMTLAVAWTTGGCASGGSDKVYDLDAAVRQARERGRDVLVFYKDPWDPGSTHVRGALESGAVRPLLSGKTQTVLLPNYEPHRRRMAAYGVERTPAIVLIHPDGTYHALRGVRDAADVRSFLQRATPPGRVPQSEPAVSAPPRWDYAHVYERAVEKAQRENKRLLIVCKSWRDAASAELVRRVSHPPVVRHVQRTINCVLDWDYPPNREHAAKYGVSRYPALVLVHPDGRHRSVTGLPSSEQIVEFIRGEDVARR